jgi:pyrroloquinoline quinone biosynthesis protein B
MPPAIQAILLGTAQDGGVPQAGCQCAACAAAWVDPSQRRLVSALGLVDRAAGAAFMIDATPDFREQLHHLQTAAPGLPLAGLLLTHAHIGHYTGLIHLGYEAMATRGLPVYGTRRMLAFLREHAPWRQLVDQGQVALHELTPGVWRPLTPNLAVQPLLVPHRDEWSDTVGYVVGGSRRHLLYLPDIDSWEAWARPPFARGVREVVAGVDAALLDGTFYADGELPGRDLHAIGHPWVTDTLAALGDQAGKVTLIHLNHTNPLLRAGPERQAVEGPGLRVGQEGTVWEL